MQTVQITLDEELVFDLAVKYYPQVYVIDAAGCWIGSINRSTVLNNVINF